MSAHSRRNQEPSQGTKRRGISLFLRRVAWWLGYEQSTMKDLESYVMLGAEFDSSARDPPPRCHPGTRKSILESIQTWSYNTVRRKRILWLVGSAGSGKSAIMQTLAERMAESPGPNLTLGATLFFSVPNERNNPLQVFITLAYQISLSYPLYRKFLVQEFISDPQLPEQSMETQFARLIAGPFTQPAICQGMGELLILLDGLDECEGHDAQCEIVSLISSFSLQHPNAPLTWIIASRPETHLQAIFSRGNVMPSYDRGNIPVDSNEAFADVESYLRAEFERIRKGDPIARLRPRWPTENQLLEIAAAAAGLFVYARTITKLVGDRAYANPISRLEQLLAATNEIPTSSPRRGAHPLAHLDILYTSILSEIPEDMLPDTILLLTNHLVLQRFPTRWIPDLAFLCNWSGTTSPDAYSALHRLHSVLKIPAPEKANEEQISFHHRTFYEYLRDPNRSHRFHISNVVMDGEEIKRGLRILKEAHSDVIVGEGKSTPISKVVLSWPTTQNEKMQENLYECAVTKLSQTLDRYNPDFVVPRFQDPGFVRVIKEIDLVNPRLGVSQRPADDVEYFYCIQRLLNSRICAELEKLGLSQEVPIRRLNFDEIQRDFFIFILCECNSEQEQPDLQGIPNMHSNPETVDYGSGYKYWWFTDRTKPQASLLEVVRRNLQLVQEHSPDTPVRIFGNVACTYLLYEFKTPDRSQRWSYYVPLNPSVVIASGAS